MCYIGCICVVVFVVYDEYTEVVSRESYCFGRLREGHSEAGTLVRTTDVYSMYTSQVATAAVVVQQEVVFAQKGDADVMCETRACLAQDANLLGTPVGSEYGGGSKE